MAITVLDGSSSTLYTTVFSSNGLSYVVDWMINSFPQDLTLVISGVNAYGQNVTFSVTNLTLSKGSTVVPDDTILLTGEYTYDGDPDVEITKIDLQDSSGNSLLYTKNASDFAIITSGKTLTIIARIALVGNDEDIF